MKLLYYLPMLLCLAYTARGEEIEKDTAKIRNVELNEVSCSRSSNSATSGWNPCRHRP